MAIASGWSDPYAGQRYYEEQDRRYREMAERQRYEAMRQQQAYNPYTDTYGGVTAQQIQEGKKPKPMPTPEYLDNKKLLLLEN